MYSLLEIFGREVDKLRWILRWICVDLECRLRNEQSCCYDGNEDLMRSIVCVCGYDIIVDLER